MLLKKVFAVVMVALFATLGTTTAQEKYAVIIAGNMNPGSTIPDTEQWNGGQGGSLEYGFDEFWNDSYLNWEMLVFDKDYTDANVNVLFGAGVDFTFDQQDIRYKGINHGWQYEVVTDANSYKQTINTIFTNLASSITADDFLFVWIMSHGGTDANGSYFYSYDNQKVYDNELATWLGGIAAHKKTVFLSLPNSGGFIPELEGAGNIVITAGAATEGASRADDLAPGIPPVTFIENEVLDNITYNHGEVNYHLFSSLTGETPLGETVYSNIQLSTVDVDSDGFVDLNETWNWTSNTVTISGETPVCSDQDNIKSTTEFIYPTLLHADISTHSTYRGLIGVAKNVNVSGSSELEFLDNSKIYFPNNAVHIVVYGNSSFIIGDYCEFVAEEMLSYIDINSSANIVFGSHVSFTGWEPGSIKFWVINIGETSNSIVLNDFTFICGDIVINSPLLEINNSFFHWAFVKHFDGTTNSLVTESQFKEARLFIDNGNAIINDCDFKCTTIDNILSYENQLTLDGCPEYSIRNSRFISSLESGIEINNSGTCPQGLHEIMNNEISDCGQLLYSGAGIRAYNSRVDIHNNVKIENNTWGIQSLNNSQVSILGNRSANYVSETQQIHDNDINQIYATYGAFPYEMRWNAIYDEDNDCLFMYDSQIEEPAYDVAYNFWGNNFNPQEDLCPTDLFSWLPVWNLQFDNPPVDGDEQLFYASKTLADSGNCTQAKSGYQLVVATYPASKYSTASLKEMFIIEEAAGNNYASLKSYYGSIINQQNNDGHVKIADFLYNLCDIKLENYTSAISWYENVIQDPPSFADSLFAIIDLGYLYVKMGNDSLKSVPIGNMPEYKPVSKEQHAEYRDYLLSLLKGYETSRDDQQVLSYQSKVAAFLPNVPNPFSGVTNIQYSLKEEGSIQIRIYDYSGRLFKLIDEGIKPKGKFFVPFLSDILTPGVYMCSIKFNGVTVDTQKISHIR